MTHPPDTPAPPARARDPVPGGAAGDAAAVPVLEIDRLAVTFDSRAGPVPAVVDVSLTVAAGESVALVGESGCGKSTVAMAVMRHLGRSGRIAGGTVRFKGRDLTALSAAELRAVRGREIAMVYQEPFAALNPGLTVATQLAEVPMVHEGLDTAAAIARARDMLCLVRVADPDRVLGAYPHQLSGGQQQRVVIAMALLSRPALLLCDEPTTALDVTVEAGIVALIGEIKRTLGTSVLFISHNLGLVREVADRVCVMYAGAVVEDGPVADVFADRVHPYTRGLFDCIPTPGTDKRARPLSAIPGRLPLPQERPAGCAFAPRCRHALPGRCDAGAVALAPRRGRPDHAVRCARADEPLTPDGASAAREAAPADQGEVVLTIDGMRKYYPVHDRSLLGLVGRRGVRWVKANESLSFVAHRRQTVAIVGESGCGKSTVAKVLMGLETATDGRVAFRGDELARRPVRKRTPDQLGALQMVFQNPTDTLNPSVSVGAQIRRVITKLGLVRDPAVAERRMFELLDLVKLPRGFARRKPRQLSGGQKQRVGIARAFAGTPSLVVADEPLSALDVSVQAAVTQLLIELQRSRDTTLLFISHDLMLVRYLADHIIVMYLGRIMEQGPVATLFDPPYHPYTEALLSAVPIADAGIGKRRILLEGVLPSALDPPAGCPFASRCPRKLSSICDTTPPPVQRVSERHTITCHIPLDELSRVGPVFYPLGGAPQPEAAD